MSVRQHSNPRWLPAIVLTLVIGVLLALGLVVTSGNSKASTSKPVASMSGDYVSDGTLDLRDIAAKLGTTPSTLLRMTANHFGEYNHTTYLYLNSVFDGNATWNSHVPSGAEFWRDPPASPSPSPSPSSSSASPTPSPSDSSASPSPTQSSASPSPSQTSSASAPSWNPNGNYSLAFDDEFNGSSLSSSWAHSWFNGGTMNNVSTSPANVSVSGGNLILTLASSSSGALVNTDPAQLNGGGFQFGDNVSVESRVFFPGSGSTIYNWPAFWTDGQNWPTNGENDIAEGLGTMTTNYHSPQGASNSGTIPGNWGGSWHTYGLDRENGVNKIYFDGQLVRTYSTDDAGAPHYLIFNVGNGNQSVYGAGSQVKVDWVRVWNNN